jgi:hypothetical protein
MSFSLCAVIADAFTKPKEKTGSSLRPLPAVNAIAIHGRDRRSGCTPAEPYPPARARSSPKTLNIVTRNDVGKLN